MSILNKILKAPIQLLVIVSFGASWYAAYAKIQNISWAVPIIYTLILGAYVIGNYMENQRVEVQVQ